ncbi:MAG TPA: oligoendopeptidase F [Albitalea sp.]|uniref:oligoendopeptidase F n=1 Tax=Piscinibacter sp. TaxID=1903157 RepID=UPI002ED11D4C
MRFVFAAAVAAMITAPVARAEPIADRWNLADVYPSQAAWDADAKAVQDQLGRFAACKGHLGDSPRRLRECLDLRADMTKRLSRLWVFASQQLAEDTGVAASQQLQQQVELLDNQVEVAGAFVDPELLRLGARRIDRFVTQDPGLRIHRFPLRRTLRAAPHTLDGAGERLVATFGKMSNAGQSAYGTLSNADMPWPSVKLADGETVTLDQSAYTKYRESARREDRKKVMDAFWGTWKNYERTLGGLLYAQLKQEAVYSSVRRYPDSITRTLDRDHIPVAVIDTLIAQTNANLPTLHRYFRLRARMLGVTDMRYYDIYPPLVHGDYKFPLATAKQLTLEAVAPLGKDYQQAMAAGFDSRWMDAYPRPRKQSGAHMAGYAYDVHPYVLMNYNDDYESVTTLAHEWGHAMHSHLSNHAQPFVTASYATFVAEIASTFNEQLLLERMLKTAKDDDERVFYLGSALEGLRATYFRQVMFAEFERDIHARVDRGESLTGEALTQHYCAILKRYHGADQGVVTIDEPYCIEWAYIPHFYNAFYVYQYATSIAASALFADRVASGDPKALERYLGLLRAGDSDYPYELVKAAGVDLATPAPYQAIVARMNGIMDRIEAILAKRR